MADGPKQRATRKTDRKARVVLFSDFADQIVVVERVDDDEVRVRKAVVVPNRKYTLPELLATSPPETFQGDVNFGPPVGNELL
jgi:hypothetical protein